MRLHHRSALDLRGDRQCDHVSLRERNHGDHHDDLGQSDGATIGNNVTVANVNVAGYNGTFVVTAIPSGTTFQYTAASGLGAGTGGTAAADTFECGMVDQGAALIPNDNGKVLLAGGDVVAFLGQSSNLSLGAGFTIDTVQFGATDTSDYAIVTGLTDTPDLGQQCVPSGDIATALGLASVPYVGPVSVWAGGEVSTVSLPAHVIGRRAPGLRGRIEHFRRVERGRHDVRRDAGRRVRIDAAVRHHVARQRAGDHCRIKRNQREQFARCDQGTSGLGKGLGRRVEDDPQTKSTPGKLTNTSPAGCDVTATLTPVSAPAVLCSASLTGSPAISEGDTVASPISVNCTCTGPTSNVKCTAAGAPFPCCTGSNREPVRRRQTRTT